MKRQENTRRRSLLAFGAAGLAAAALLALWALGSAGQASAEPHPGLNFTISAGSFCNSSQGDTQCYIPPGTTFTLSVTLEPLPSDIPSYEGFDLNIEYTGLTSADNASVDHWPDCGFPATDYESARVVMGCAIDVKPAPPSTYVGVMGTNDFTCSQSGTISLRHGAGYTDLFQNIATVLSEPGAADTLTITCGSPPPPPMPTLVGSGSGGAFDQSSSSEAGLWLAVASLLGLTGASLIVLRWRFARSR